MFNLPNALTVANLFFGCCALISLIQGREMQCIYFVLLASAFDFLDGFVARKMKQESELGVQLDSLSDVVTFGVVPGMISFHILSLDPPFEWLPYFGFLIAIAAAFRLARYNVSSSGRDVFFTGLPVPACGLFFCGMLALRNSDVGFKDYLMNPYVFTGIVILFSYLMISHLKILKIHLSKEWLDQYKFVLIIEILSLFAMIRIGAIVLSLVILIHILLSLLVPTFKNKITTT